MTLFEEIAQATKSGKDQIHGFNWDGPGTISIVEMTWKGIKMKFECPISMAVFYKESQKQNSELLEALKELSGTAKRAQAILRRDYSEPDSWKMLDTTKAEQAIKKVEG